MGAVIRLTMITGPEKGKRFCMRAQNSCLVGRARECQVRFDDIKRCQFVSRRHCELHFDPPELHVEDLGSVNGTYINGQKLEDHSDVSGDTVPGDHPCGVAEDGDILTIGGTTVQVHVMDCPLACPDHAVDGVEWKECDIVKDDCPLTCQE